MRHLGVRFVCEEEPPSADSALALNAADLADLPVALLNKLEEALVRLDIDAVNRPIESICALHPSKAGALEAMARDDLQFGRILRMVRAACSGTGPDTRDA